MNLIDFDDGARVVLAIDETAVIDCVQSLFLKDTSILKQSLIDLLLNLHTSLIMVH